MAILTADEIEARLDRETPQPASGNVHTRVVLEAGDAAWDPSKFGPGATLIHGPAVLLYTRYADGGVEAAQMG